VACDRAGTQNAHRSVKKKSLLAHHARRPLTCIILTLKVKQAPHQSWPEPITRIHIPRSVPGELPEHLQGLVEKKRPRDKVTAVDVQQEAGGVGNKEDGGAVQGVD
jgi:hypothetical protein